MLGDVSYKQLVAVLEQQYQLADQITLYRTQLQSSRQGQKETLGELGDEEERLVRLAYPSAEGDIADDLARDRFVVSRGDGGLRHWVYQACPSSYTEARAAALQGGILSWGEGA